MAAQRECVRCGRPLPGDLEAEQSAEQGWRGLTTESGTIVGPVCSECLGEDEQGTVLGAEEWQRFYEATE